MERGAWKISVVRIASQINKNNANLYPATVILTAAEVG
jgi:hypothetical protein